MNAPDPQAYAKAAAALVAHAQTTTGMSMLDLSAVFRIAAEIAAQTNSSQMLLITLGNALGGWKPKS